MTDPDMGTWQYDYDALGNLTSQTDARGCTTSLTYDTLNRLTLKTFSGCTPSTPVIDYYYDGMGFSFDEQDYASATNQNGYRTGMRVNGSNAAIWTCDLRGRVTGEQRMFIGAAFYANWTYNSADLPITMTYPDGEEVTYGYNSSMQVETLSGAANYMTGTGYDAAGRVRLRRYVLRESAPRRPTPSEHPRLLELFRIVSKPSGTLKLPFPP